MCSISGLPNDPRKEGVDLIGGLLLHRLADVRVLREGRADTRVHERFLRDARAE